MGRMSDLIVEALSGNEQTRLELLELGIDIRQPDAPDATVNRPIRPRTREMYEQEEN